LIIFLAIEEKSESIFHASSPLCCQTQLSFFCWRNVCPSETHKLQWQTPLMKKFAQCFKILFKMDFAILEHSDLVCQRNVIWNKFEEEDCKSGRSVPFTISVTQSCFSSSQFTSLPFIEELHCLQKQEKSEGFLYAFIPEVYVDPGFVCKPHPQSGYFLILLLNVVLRSLWFSLICGILDDEYCVCV
jgi:hypothetical protein